MKAKKNELENRVFVSDVAKDILTPNEPKKSRAAPGASVGPRVKVESLAEVKVDFSVQVQAWADAEAKAEREIGKTQWDLGEQVSKYREDSIPVKRIRERLKEDSTEVFGKQ